jgi:hypothetical protein
MSKPATVPHAWPEIENSVREAVIAMASILGHFGPDDGGATVAAFLGREVGIPDPQHMDEQEKASIDITRHFIHGHVRRAYAYAYQLDGWEDASPEDVYEISCGLLSGYAQTDLHGEPTALNDLNDPPLRRVLETFLARWSWAEEGSDLTVRQLALLANMTDATVRSSLSKEGLKLSTPDDDSGTLARNTLAAGDAQQWLARRRGFIPNRRGMTPELQRSAAEAVLDDRQTPFPDALRHIVSVSGQTIEEIAARSGTEADWVTKLLDGTPVEPDVGLLKRMADALGAPRAAFVGKAVGHLISVEPA